MQVKVTTDRGVWINDAPRARGDVQTVTDEEAVLLFQHGFAEPETPVTAADLNAAHQCSVQPQPEPEPEPEPEQASQEGPTATTGRRRRGV
jgi:hypothetical protein